MILPGFTADASLYRTMNLYRSGPLANTLIGPGEGLVSLQLDCGLSCAATWTVCNVGCALSLDPFCLVGCGVNFVDCLENCSSGGGGGGGPPSCCPPGKSCQCGGRCVPGKGCMADMPWAGATLPLVRTELPFLVIKV